MIQDAYDVLSDPAKRRLVNNWVSALGWVLHPAARFFGQLRNHVLNGGTRHGGSNGADLCSVSNRSGGLSAQVGRATAA